MKIALDISVLNDKNKTGIGVYTYNLIDSILKINKEDQFILFGFATIATYDYLKNIDLQKYQNVKVKIYPLPAKTFGTIFNLWQKFDFPPIEYLTGQIDIYHSFNWYLPPSNKAKIVATVYDLTSILYPNYHLKNTIKMDKMRFQRIAKSANSVVAISNSTKNDFLRIYPGCKVEVVYPAAFKKDIKTYNTKLILEKYNIKKPYFLSVATLEPRKNITGVIKAYLNGNFSKQLVLVGGMGWLNEEIDFLLKKSNKIIVTGFVSDSELNAIYSEAFAFLYPSFYEGFGMPVLEAMSYGIPVVTSKISSLPEVCRNSALYVDPNSEDSILEGMNKISNQILRKKLIENAYKNIKRFSWEKSAKKQIQIYHSL